MTQTVVLTGAAAGVGRATARAFGQRGANLVLIARSAESLAAAKAEVEQAGGKAIAVAADVADADALEQAAERAEREFGAIDIWINCAMATIFSRFVDITPEEYRRATEVTYLGFVYGTMAALRRMRPRNHGTIVQVGSALAYRAIPLQAPYCGAKFAIRGFTDSLRSELLHERSRIHLTMVQMPALNTPQFDWALNKTGRRPQPVPPIFQPEVAAEAIVFASHARRREVYVGWPTVKAILANKVIPGVLDRYLAKAGYNGQLTDEPDPADRPANLYKALPRDHGAHGRFDARAKPRSLQLQLNRQRSLLLAAGSGLAAFGLALWLGGRTGEPAKLPARAA